LKEKVDVEWFFIDLIIIMHRECWRAPVFQQINKIEAHTSLFIFISWPDEYLPNVYYASGTISWRVHDFIEGIEYLHMIENTTNDMN